MRDYFPRCLDTEGSHFRRPAKHHPSLSVTSGSRRMPGHDPACDLRLRAGLILINCAAVAWGAGQPGRAEWGDARLLGSAAHGPIVGRRLDEPTQWPFTGRWEERNWRNVPGPFYAGETDSLQIGRLAAPDHVCYDDDIGNGFGFEFIYR
jgi:hypothetical protein